MVLRKLGPLVHTVAQGLSELFFPPRCAGCSTNLPSEAPFCTDCQETLAPAKPQGTHEAKGGVTVTSAYAYQGALIPALHKLKWEGRDDLGRPLGGLLSPLLPKILEGVDVLVPMPLHPKRLAQRGYNQSLLLLLGALAKGPPTKLPQRPKVDVDLLFRRLPAPPPGPRGRAEREEVVRDAFEVSRSARRSLQNAKVVVCDDVVTTGASARAAAQALFFAGAQEVQVLTLCRASR